MIVRTLVVCAAALVGLTGAAPRPAPTSPVHDWVPDYQFRGALTGWTPVGEVAWTVEGDEIVARPRPGSAGGFLVFDRPLQDVAAFVEFRCAQPCEAGLLLRAERTPEGGLRGDLASFGSEPGQLRSVSADRTGKLDQAERLAAANVQARFATPAAGAPAGAAPSVPGVDNPLKPLFPHVVAPVIPVGGTAETAQPGPDFNPLGFARPSAGTAPTGFGADAWNTIEVLADTNVAQATLNGGRLVRGVTPDNGNGFGPVALYVGPGSGEVCFRNAAFRDLARHVQPAEYVSPRYTMRKLEDFSYAWDATVADVNHDGVNDIVAGPYAYLGPDFTERRELYIASTFSPGNQYAANMVTYAWDFTGDGWPDVLVTEGRQLALLVNPRNAPRRWTRHMVVPGNLSEIPLLDDLDGDGRPELLIVQDGRLAFAQPKRGDPTAPWPVFYVSDRASASLHSFGVGDINGDGRKDIVQAKGWWEQPAGGLTSTPWTFHPYNFGDPEHPGERVDGGGQMAVVDVNGDGLADVITSVNAHGWGLAWYEQTRAGGKISFIPHLIMGDFTRRNPGGLTVSQLHAGVVALDVDHDGVVDFFTGKKQWAHLDSHLDPDPEGAAYLLLYHGVRDAKAPGGVRFVPEVIHNRSGVGSRLTVADVNKDGIPDVVTAGVHGAFVFFGKPSSVHRGSRQ